MGGGIGVGVFDGVGVKNSGLSVGIEMRGLGFDERFGLMILVLIMLCELLFGVMFLLVGRVIMMGIDVDGGWNSVLNVDRFLVDVGS